MLAAAAVVALPFLLAKVAAWEVLVVEVQEGLLEAQILCRKTARKTQVEAVAVLTVGGVKTTVAAGLAGT